jgi:hypothetical protein
MSEPWKWLSGATIIKRTHTKGSETVFIRLPDQLCRPIEDGCSCPYCIANPTIKPTWDTLAVPIKGMTVYTVHMPEITHE